MKNKILMFAIFGMFLFSVIGVLATVPNTQVYTQPLTITLTSQNQTGYTLSQVKSALNLKSCNVDANWQNKSCTYTFFCGVVLPSQSTSINDALWKECVDVSDQTSGDASITINQFLPPKGVLYYFTTFYTIINETYSTSTSSWTANTTIPTQYIHVNPIRSVCPTGQMLNFNQNTGQYQCYTSTAICLDTLKTGVCTNTYQLYALDANNDGIVNANELITPSNFCVDRPSTGFPNGDGICDITTSQCTDICSRFNSTGSCIQSGSNGVCDDVDMGAYTACVDSKIHSGICESVDSALCSTNYNPVCVANTSGTNIGGTTYPNSCFAQQKGYSACANGIIGTNCYSPNSCLPAVVQCYSASDCIDAQTCANGDMSGITKSCINYRCSYSGQCKSLSCSTNAQCSGITTPCVGVSPTCVTGLCTIQGSCIQKPQTTTTIWTQIGSVWSNFWGWITGLFA